MKNNWSRMMLVASLVLLSFCSFAFSQDEIYLQKGSRWTISSNGVTYVPVCWENAAGYSTEALWVKSAIESTWENYANVDFQGWGNCYSSSSGIRIRVIDNRSNVKVLGRFLDGRVNGMDLNFSFANFSPSCQNKLKFCIQAIAVHEFGHALGLAHEQDQPTSICYEGRTERQNALVITPYDEDSVMNYCNRKWNNGGNLSYYDIQGIQQIYGKRNSSNTTYGYISVLDELGDDQVWEEVIISLGSTEKKFTINKSQPSNSVKWSFSDSGTYCFKFSTRALHTDGNIYKGYGEKCYPLISGKNYSPLSLARDDWNSNGYYNIILK